jgi:hypothetical protein
MRPPAAPTTARTARAPMRPAPRVAKGERAGRASTRAPDELRDGGKTIRRERCIAFCSARSTASGAVRTTRLGASAGSCWR